MTTNKDVGRKDKDRRLITPRILETEDSESESDGENSEKEEETKNSNSTTDNKDDDREHDKISDHETIQPMVIKDVNPSMVGNSSTKIMFALAVRKCIFPMQKFLTDEEMKIFDPTEKRCLS